MLISDSPYLLPIPKIWHDEIRTWEIHLHTSGIRHRSVDTRIRHIRYLAREIYKAPNNVTERDLTLWLGEKNWSPETRHSHYTSIRAFFTWRCTWYGHDNNPATNLPTVRRNQGRPRPIPEETLREVLYETPPRTSLILRLAAELGLRRSEIAIICAKDITVTNDQPYIIVHGKGGKTRTLPLTRSLHKHITTYIQDRYWLLPGNTDGHLSPGAVGKIASNALPDGWSLHTLRHRFATSAYHDTNDIIAVQEALGHASLNTTRRYTQIEPRGLIKITNATEIKLTNTRPPKEKKP